MTSPKLTIAELLRSLQPELTKSERQLADSLLSNYPLSGLVSVTTVATNAGVSTPTVIRMVRKLGFDGFPQFQQELRTELEATITNPIAKHEKWASDVPEEHILNEFTNAVINNIHQTLSQISPADFDQACELLSNQEQKIYITGGRVSRSMADYLYIHLQMIRKFVSNMESRSSSWPHFILDMEENDVLVIFDVRRYENSTIKLAELAASKGLKTILFTDQWRSPVSKYADITFSARISVPSAWDSSVTLMLLLEAMIAKIQQNDWRQTKKRISDLEELFDRTTFFRKF